MDDDVKYKFRWKNILHVSNGIMYLNNMIKRYIYWMVP